MIPYRSHGSALYDAICRTSGSPGKCDKIFVIISICLWIKTAQVAQYLADLLQVVDGGRWWRDASMM
jgi:hypothetical protein